MRVPNVPMINKISLWRTLVTFVLVAACMLPLAATVQADTFQSFKLSATGQVVSDVPCSPTHLCQEAIVSGRATRFGAFTGYLSETIDITNGTYSGTGTFTTTAGDTLSTTYVGRVSPPDSSGGVTFTEIHRIVGGSGQFAGATGQLLIVGSADVAGRLSIAGLGVLIR